MPSAAYAVTKNPDGTVDVTVRWNQLHDPDALNARLRQAGVRAAVMLYSAPRRCRATVALDPTYSTLHVDLRQHPELAKHPRALVAYLRSQEPWIQYDRQRSGDLDHDHERDRTSLTRQISARKPHGLAAMTTAMIPSGTTAPGKGSLTVAKPIGIVTPAWTRGGEGAAPVPGCGGSTGRPVRRLDRSARRRAPAPPAAPTRQRRRARRCRRGRCAHRRPRRPGRGLATRRW